MDWIQQGGVALGYAGVAVLLIKVLVTLGMTGWLVAGLLRAG